MHGFISGWRITGTIAPASPRRRPQRMLSPSALGAAFFLGAALAFSLSPSLKLPLTCSGRQQHTAEG